MPDLYSYVRGMDKLTCYVIDCCPDVNSALALTYADDICISNYDLSPVGISSRVCFAMEELYGVL